MKRLLSIVLIVFVIILSVSSCMPRGNSEFEEYRTKVDAVIAYGEGLAEKNGTDARPVSMLNISDGSFYDEMMSDKNKQVIADYGDNYLKITNIAFQLPMICGYAGTEMHGMTSYFGEVFMTEAFTGEKQYIITDKTSEGVYVTRVASSAEYQELRLDYRADGDFSYELVTCSTTSGRISYHYGDSDSNYIGFDAGRAEIHIAGDDNGYISFDEAVVDYYINNVDIGMDISSAKSFYSGVLGTEVCTLTRSDITKSLEDVFNTFIGEDEVLEDELGFYHNGTTDTAYLYVGEDTDVLTIPENYSKLNVNFSIRAVVEELVIPATVTQIIDDMGNPVAPNHFLVRAFDGDASLGLKRITVEDGSPLFYSKDGDLYDKLTDTLIYVSNHKRDVLDLDVKLGEYLDWDVATDTFTTPKEVIVNAGSTQHIYEALLNQYGLYPSLDRYVINGITQSEIRIDETNYGKSKGSERGILTARTLVFNAKDGDPTFASIRIMCENPAWEKIEYTSYSDDFRHVGVMFGVKELYIDDPLFRFYGGDCTYPDLEKIVFAEGISVIYLEGLDISLGHLEIYLPTTTTHINIEPYENATYYIPYCKAYYDEVIRRDIGIPTLVGTDEELRLAEIFTMIEFTSGIATIIEIAPSSGDLYIPDEFFGYPTARIDVPGDRTYSTVSLPKTVVSLATSDKITVDTIDFRGTKEEAKTLNLYGVEVGTIMCTDGEYSDRGDDGGEDVSDATRIPILYKLEILTEQEVFSFELAEIALLDTEIARVNIYINGMSNEYIIYGNQSEIEYENYIFNVNVNIPDDKTILLHVLVSTNDESIGEVEEFIPFVMPQ